MEQSQLPKTMATKPLFRTKHTDTFLFLGALFALFLFYALLSSFNSNPTFLPNIISSPRIPNALREDPPDVTFYDDPNLTYLIEQRVFNWDEKRREWLKKHPGFNVDVDKRIILVSGSQPGPCRSPVGDHLLLRFFKNKVDYSRIHGYDLFYNNAFFHPKMMSFWAKLPVVRSVMVAHPEAEWVWWVDSDAAFTDMDFKLPLERYKDHNLIVHGWENMIYENKSWVGLNAGIFLIRNCQWSMDFMDVWASMGPQTPDFKKWGEIQRSTFKDKLFPESDDQSALVYLLLKEKEKWADKIYLESEYCFEGYWKEIVDSYKNITDKYTSIEREAHILRRRHAEKVTEYYSTLRELYLKSAGVTEYGKGSNRRPFITHFTGCQPCSGDHNEMYSRDSCLNGMEMALNFADNQVLRSFGFIRHDLLDSSVSPLMFDQPA